MLSSFVNAEFTCFQKAAIAVGELHPFRSKHKDYSSVVQVPKCDVGKKVCKAAFPCAMEAAVLHACSKPSIFMLNAGRVGLLIAPKFSLSI